MLVDREKEWQREIEEAVKGLGQFEELKLLEEGELLDWGEKEKERKRWRERRKKERKS